MRCPRLALPLLLLGAVAVGAGCSTEPEACPLSGTLTPWPGLEERYTGLRYRLYIDVDLSPDVASQPLNSNHVAMLDGTLPNGALQYSVDISNVPSGTYYMYLIVYAGWHWMKIGYYGLEPPHWWQDVPDAPNAAVSCGAAIDFWLIEYDLT